MSTYDKNVEELKSKYPEVYDWILRADEDQQLEIIRSANGLDNLRIKGFQGKGVYYYDMQEPLKEEEELCQNFDFSADQVTFLIGIGLGYIVDVIRNKKEKSHKIVVLEKNPTILKRALERIDFSDLLRNGEMIFSLPDEESIKNNVMQYASNRYPEDVFLYGSIRLMLANHEYFELKERVIEYLGSPLLRTCTGVNNGPVLAKNEMDNLPKLLFSAGIKNLVDKFSWKPAIIVSAGPSLEKNVYQLKQAKGNALIVATAPVVRVLLAHDLKPDLIVSIDFNDDNRIHFDGLCDLTDCPLVYPVRLTPRIVKDFQGNLFAIQDLAGLCKLLGHNWEFKGYIQGGGSVSIYALMIVLFLDCNPIIFIGQDLAYTDRSHIDGVFLAEKIDLAKSGRRFLWVDGLYGGRVPTIGTFMSYKLEIESIIKTFPGRKFINCTEGGASIKGTEVMPLQECLEKYCQNGLDVQSILNESKGIEEVDFAGLVRDIQRIIRQIKEMSQLCGKGLKSNKSIRKRMNQGLIGDPELERIILENHRDSTVLQRFCESFDPLSIYLRKEVHKINRHEYIYDSSAGYNQREDLRIGLRRNKMILCAAQNALKEVKGKLCYLLWVFRRIENCRRQLMKEGMDGKAHYLYGRILAEIGLYCRAVEEYSRALELGQEDGEVFHSLARSYLCLERLALAEEVLQKAPRKYPEEAVIKELFQELEETRKSWLAKAESFLEEGNWVNALLYARKMLREYPGHLRAKEIARETENLRDEKVKKIEAANHEEREKRCIQREHRALVERAQESLKRREYPQALEYLEKALQLDHSQAEAMNLMACCYAEQGEMGKARNLYEELSAKFPHNGVFHLNLGRAYIRNGLYLEAAEELEAAASKDARCYFGLYEAGAIYMKSKNYDKAIACFEKYLAMSPDSYELLAKIGTCYLAKRMPKLAKMKYQAALRIQPEYEAARVGLQKIEAMEKSLNAQPMAVP